MQSAQRSSHEGRCLDDPHLGEEPVHPLSKLPLRRDGVQIAAGARSNPCGT
jgi:hypothetical protein